MASEATFTFFIRPTFHWHSLATYRCNIEQHLYMLVRPIWRSMCTFQTLLSSARNISQTCWNLLSISNIRFQSKTSFRSTNDESKNQIYVEDYQTWPSDTVFLHICDLISLCPFSIVVQKHSHCYFAIEKGNALGMVLYIKQWTLVHSYTWIGCVTFYITIVCTNDRDLKSKCIRFFLLLHVVVWSIKWMI